MQFDVFTVKNFTSIVKVSKYECYSKHKFNTLVNDSLRFFPDNSTCWLLDKETCP